VFVAWGLEPAQRKSAEHELLRAYYEGLTGSGVQGYEFSQCMQDYGLALLNVVVRTVLALAGLDFSSGRSQALATALLERTDALIADLDLKSLLPT
jgi:hypothetical protein